MSSSRAKGLMFVSRSAGCPHSSLLTASNWLPVGCMSGVWISLHPMCDVLLFGWSANWCFCCWEASRGCGWPQAGWQCVAKIECLIRGYVGQNGRIALTYCPEGWAYFGILYCMWETSLVKPELVQFMHSQRCNNRVAWSCGTRSRVSKSLCSCNLAVPGLGLRNWDCILYGLLCRFLPDIVGNRFWAYVRLGPTVPILTYLLHGAESFLSS